VIQAERIILGIDPGTNILGYGIIATRGKHMELVTLDVLKLDKVPDPYLKLKVIFETITQLVKENAISEVALEAPFFGKNVQSMLKLGRAQGVAMAAALALDVPVTEYSPLRIKQSITGKGLASKEQVSEMLKRLLNIQENHRYLDATDGLAVAVCHFFQNGPVVQSTGSKKKTGGWDRFIQENPDRKL
jgi:crossover junction endodeoxyribonuclease RuvC